MDTIWKIIGGVSTLIVILLMVIGVFYCTSNECKFDPLKSTPFKLIEEPEEKEEISSVMPILKDILITEIEMNRKIYEKRSVARVEFAVLNGLEIPYNITVSWIHDGIKYRWSNRSTDISNNYRSYFYIKEEGVWKVHVEIDCKHWSCPKEELVEFEVY